MTASKRYVPVSLVCLLIASTYSATTNPATAGPSSSLDPYAHVQAPTAKEVEEKNNKARAKKGLPPIHKNEPSSTKVEDISSTTTYVTAPGGGNGKAMKQNSAVAESGATGGKLFGKFPKIGLPSMPSLPMLGKGKAKSEQEPEAKMANAVKEKPSKEKSTKVAVGKAESKTVKETPVGDEIETSSIASAAKHSAGESQDNMVTKTLKATTSGVVSGSKKVGSGIANGAKASGSVIAKGAAMLGSGFKATGEKIKGGSGKIATIGVPHMPNPFEKKSKGGSTAVGLATPFVASREQSQGSKKKLASANSQSDLIKESMASTKPRKSSNLPETDELISEKAVAAAAKDSKGGMAFSEKMTSTFSKLNPFSKKGIAGKKQKQTL
ncbi:hypothetical protein KBI23_24870 [bacterium]|nr:hypothetical protein [bacterium]MBP9809705.1 hypothetical protein [bacterium]